MTTTFTVDPAPGSPPGIRAAADLWSLISDGQRRAADDLTAQQRAVPTFWRDSPGADALTAAMTAPSRPITGVADQLDRAAGALRVYAGELEQFQARSRLLTDAVDAARRRTAADLDTLAQAGSPLPGIGLIQIQQTAVDMDVARAAMASAAQDLQVLAADAHAAALRAAQQVQSATDGLGNWASGRAFGPVGAPPEVGLAVSAAYTRYLDALARRPPHLPTDPKAAAAAWAALDPELRARYITGQPEIIGNSSGLPAADRDAANRITLSAQVAAIRARVAAAGFTLTGDQDPAAALAAAGYSGADLKTAEGALTTDRQLSRATAGSGGGRFNC